MRTTVRAPSDRGSFFRSPGSQGQLATRSRALDGDVLMPGPARPSTIPPGIGSGKYNRSGGPSGQFTAARLEDALAKRLGFEGRHDGAWHQAKTRARKAKLAIKATSHFIEEAADQLRQLGEAQWNTGGSTSLACDYPSGNTPPVGWVYAPSNICVQGQAGPPNAYPVVVNGTSDYVAHYGLDTSILPQPYQVAFTQYIGGLPAGWNAGSVAGIQNVASPMRMIDPMAGKPLGYAKAMPLPVPWALAMGVQHVAPHLQGNSRSYGTEKAVAEQVSATDIAISLSPQTGVKVTKEPVVKTRTRVGVRERKSVVVAPAVVQAAVNAVTETEDFVDAFYEALPEKILNRERAKRHGKNPGFVDKMALLYRHWYQVDLNAAIINLLKNEFEDRVIGTLSQKANKGINRHWTRPVGVTFGPGL